MGPSATRYANQNLEKKILLPRRAVFGELIGGKGYPLDGRRIGWGTSRKI